MGNELGQHPNLYLRQHGENPVHWKAWSPEVWADADAQNKLVIVSIGYSACHWCHVMEKECFEDHEVGQLMNQHFLSIKIDREERPDIDQTYMSAIQAMGKNGGWPLNCICLPDGRPIFGGTYFNKQQWIQILKELQQIYFDQYDTVIGYANELQSHLDQWQKRFDTEEASILPLVNIIEHSQHQLDMDFGGIKGSPKFPMPPLLLFLLKFHSKNPQPWLKKWIEITFSEMAAGGLWDWVDGGFSRYSVDHRWHIPHFEKMLYDNAQLLQVYTTLQKIQPDPFWKWITNGIIEWVDSFLKSPLDLYYSATDADSEGEEGKYFCWTEIELKDCLGSNYEILNKHFDIAHHSYWEEGKIVLRKTSQNLPEQWEEIKQSLVLKRKEKVPPVVDKKILLSWNALLLQSFCEIEDGKEKAIELFKQITKHFYINNIWWGTIYEDGNIREAQSDGLAFMLKACIDLYFKTSDALYWKTALNLYQQIESHFHDEHSPYFYFGKDKTLFVATKDMDDHVVPSANAVIAESLYWMGILDGNMHWISKSKEMTHQRLDIENPLLSASQWLQNQLLFEQKAAVILYNPEEHPSQNRPFSIHRFIQIKFDDSAPSIMKNKKTEGNLYYVCNTEQCIPITHHIDDFLAS
jgi:uncharacterized protein